MNKKKIRELVMNAGIFAVIMGLTFWSVFRGQDIAEIVGAIGQMSGVYLAASAFLAVFFVAALLRLLIGQLHGEIKTAALTDHLF